MLAVFLIIKINPLLSLSDFIDGVNLAKGLYHKQLLTSSILGIAYSKLGNCGTLIF